jgi:hypothetical protein
MPSIINATTTNGVAVSGDNSGSLALQTNNGTTAVTISTGQNVGIGTVSPNEKLDVVANSSGEDGAIVVRTQFGANYFGGVGNYPAFGYKSGGVLYAALGYDTNNNNLFTGPASSKFPAFLARAWVNFNGTGTVAIRGSGNVSSITDNGTGDYTVNFSTAMPDVNYATTAIGQNSAATQFGTIPNVVTRATTSVRLYYHNAPEALRDGAEQCVVIHR